MGKPMNNRSLAVRREHGSQSLTRCCCRTRTEVCSLLCLGKAPEVACGLATCGCSKPPSSLALCAEQHGSQGLRGEGKASLAGCEKTYSLMWTNTLVCSYTHQDTRNLLGSHLAGCSICLVKYKCNHHLCHNASHPKSSLAHRVHPRLQVAG